MLLAGHSVVAEPIGWTDKGSASLGITRFCGGHPSHARRRPMRRILLIDDGKECLLGRSGATEYPIATNRISCTDNG